MLYDVSFQIPKKYVEECGKFRCPAGRRRCPQRQVDAGSKKTGWDVMICGDMEESDESETRHVERDGQIMGCSVASLTGQGHDMGWAVAALTGQVFV